MITAYPSVSETPIPGPLRVLGGEEARSPLKGNASRAEKLRVLVCTAHPLVRAGLQSVILQTPGAAPTGDACEAAHVHEVLRAGGADVVVLDDANLRLDGLELMRRLAAEGLPTARTVVLAAEHDDERLLGYLRAGAQGLLLRDGPTEEVVRAVHAVARGDVFITPSIARYVIDSLIRHVPVSLGSGPRALEALTPREREIFELLATGMSNAEIAKALSVAEKTIKFHVSNILGKLRLRNRVQVVTYAMRLRLGDF